MWLLTRRNKVGGKGLPEFDGWPDPPTRRACESAKVARARATDMNSSPIWLAVTPKPKLIGS
ncbi:hypothetical protein MB901379_03249 [Mycobacterium basiliense]|uniref:Uncharacterized protein n=1 Tax=Mycobacterium basiliense TaxID=2094119 RepID=A0A3S4BH78_9MYCO|nr:hypothetical protein MB901379_03249 [Mycobacterium basiliense]